MGRVGRVDKVRVGRVGVVVRAAAVVEDLEDAVAVGKDRVVVEVVDLGDGAEVREVERAGLAEAVE